MLIFAALCLSCSGCTPVQVPPAASTGRLANDLSVTVASGERRRVDFISALHPDCTSAGYVTFHVITAPTHGWITTEQGVDYPAYPKDNQRYACNVRRVPLLNIYYQSYPGYRGDDMATIEWISPVIPSATSRTLRISVR